MDTFVNLKLSLLTCILLTVASFYGLKVEKYGLLMPNVHPNMPELYLCSPIRINFTTDYYIVAFEPKASMDKIHHMVLYGCTKPGSTKSLWNCDEQKSSIINSELETVPPCESRAIFLYAWARNAPILRLPPDVGFKVGGNSAIQYLVLQTHYASTNHSNGMDHRTKLTANSSPVVDTSNSSGLILHVTQQPMSKLAGVFLLGASGEIHPHSTARWESACMIKENKKKIHPFAFRTHTHRLGTVVSGYLVKTDSQGKHHWTLIGKKDPQKPHMFYPVVNNLTVTGGDILAARCTYYSNRHHITYAGGTNDEEMCNFYTMYYVEEGEPLNMKYCYTQGPPVYYWNSELNNIPGDASTPENQI